MPRRLMTCAEPGCPELTTQTRCRKHTLERGRRIEREMGYHDRPWRWVYASPRWVALRRQVRQEQPFCAHEKCTETWTDLDHKVPLEEGGEPFARDNVEGLCKKHHSEKTNREVRERG